MGSFVSKKRQKRQAIRSTAERVSDRASYVYNTTLFFLKKNKIYLYSYIKCLSIYFKKAYKLNYILH